MCRSFNGNAAHYSTSNLQIKMLAVYLSAISKHFPCSRPNRDMSEWASSFRDADGSIVSRCLRWRARHWIHSTEISLRPMEWRGRRLPIDSQCIDWKGQLVESNASTCMNGDGYNGTELWIRSTFRFGGSTRGGPKKSQASHTLSVRTQCSSK